MKSKLFSLIVSILAAMCLWVYVMTVVNPDVDLTIGNIPVTFSGAEVLRSSSPATIRNLSPCIFTARMPILKRSTSTRTS